jgi:hypothetical protein
MILLDDEAIGKLVLVCLEIVLILMQDTFTVCDEHFIGSDRMYLMVLLGDEAQLEAHFDPFGDSANLKAR